jgi:hydrogenase maturation factor
MNLLYGQIVSVSCQEEMRTGSICVGGAMKNVLLDLVISANVGDSVLLCDGIAIAKVETKRKTENNYVFGDSGKTH